MEERPTRPGYEYFEHTADIGILARGADPQELFSNAGRGLLALIVEPSAVEEQEERSVSAEGEDWESLLVAWLEELLFLVETEGFVPRRFTFSHLEPLKIQALVSGENLDLDRHELLHEVKAVTYHELRVERTNGWEARVIVDI